MVHQQPRQCKVPFFIIRLIDQMSASLQKNANRLDTLPMALYTVELGNSDRIRLKFGSYGIEVLESEDGIRVSNLYSIDNGVKTIRTFAVVDLPLVIAPEFSKEHEAIINGQSIGSVFKNNGWVVDKRDQYFDNIEMPLTMTGRSVFGFKGATRAAVQIYSLFIRKQDVECFYASIAEVHHPEYLTLQDLKVIYGEQRRGTQPVDQRVGEFIRIIQAKMAKL